MPQINIDLLPKQFCEHTLVASNNQAFIIVPIVGSNATAYALTPEHAKELARNLTDHVKKFEDLVRPIADAVPSPIQSKDLPKRTDK